MPHYRYTARTKTGEKAEGVLEAADRRAALLQIERLGHIPVSVTEGSAPAAGGEPAKKPFLTWPGRHARMSTRELLIFTTELCDLLMAGMKLGNALNCLANRRSGKKGDEIVVALRDDIIQGTSLSDALARHPTVFSRLYINMVKAGEASGAMTDVLKRLVTHYERVQEVKEKVVMALVYPAIVLVLGSATLVFSMVFVVPKFKAIFDQLGQALPLPTRMLIATSRGLARYGWLMLGGLVALIVAGNRAVKTSEAARFRWHKMLLRAPLIRGIVACGIFANFARTLGTLLSNGVPVLQALGIVEQTVGNSVIARAIRTAREHVTDGTTISRPLAAERVFDPLMTDMLSIGEETGDMPGALEHIARRYESDLDRNVKIFTTALEPILIVVVALMVGFVAVSILMAVFSLTNGLNA